MKMKTIFHLLGWKPKVREYGFELNRFHLADEGDVEYAQWLHPKDTKKQILQADVDQLKSFLNEGDVAIDIGAHTGDSTIPIALAVGRQGKVLALEPNPYVFKILEKNACLNTDKTNIEPLMFAATEHDASLEFEYSDAGFCNGGRHEGVSRWIHGHAFTLLVKGRNLDRYMRTERRELLPRLRFIKIDAEGYDCSIVQSMRGLISETQPYLKSEIYKYTDQGQRVKFFRCLRDLGYRVHRVRSESDCFGEPITDRNLMDWRHYDIMCIPEAAQPVLQAG